MLSGIPPQSAKTDYGYIKKGDKLKECEGYRVEKFVEKPNLEDAKEYLSSGKYSWNSGIFLFQASTFLQELKKYAPKILSCTQQAVDMSHCSRDFVFIEDETMQNCPSLPIDVAIFEKQIRRSCSISPVSGRM